MIGDEQPAGEPSTTSDEYEGPLLPFVDFINLLGDHNPTVFDAVDTETVARLSVVEFGFDLPMELRLRRLATGELDLRAGPPTQHVETTVFPVLHRLRVHLVRSDITGVNDEEGTWHGV